MTNANSASPKAVPSTSAPGKSPFRIGGLRVFTRGKKGTYTADGWINDKHFRHSLRTTNKTIARTQATHLWIKLSTGDNAALDIRTGMPATPAKRHPISEVIQDYLQAKTSEQKALKTLMAYRLNLNQFQAFCDGRKLSYLDELNPKVYQDFCSALTAQRMHPKTLANRMLNLLSWGKWTYAKRTYASRSPFHGCSVPKAPEPMRFCPSLEQVQQMLRLAPARLVPHIRTLAYTGLRLGEFQHLRPQDIDLQTGLIHVRSRTAPHPWKSKSGRDRVVPIHSGLRETLTTALASAAKAKRAYVFGPLSANAKPAADARINERELSAAIQTVARQAGMKVGRRHGGFVTHALRRYFETRCVNAQVSQTLIDRWMGHQNESMGNTYYNNAQTAGVELLEKVSFE